jgi:hypothetical protein
MIDSLNNKAKEVANKLIDLSTQLADRMDTWSNSSTGPGSLSDKEHAGFINKEDAIPGINLVIDVQVPEATNEPLVRIWAIECIVDQYNRERYNNIQLTFATDADKAQRVIDQFTTESREDIRNLLLDSDTTLKNIVISDQTGRDEITQELLGNRYSVNTDELTEPELANTLGDVLDTVLAALVSSVTTKTA